MGLSSTRSLPGIRATVAEHLALTPNELIGGRRSKYRTMGRSIAAYLMRQTGLFSWSDIARALAYGDHTSALAAAGTVTARMARDPYVADLVHALQVRLGLPVTGQDQSRPLHAEGPTEEREP